ncbi:ATP binding domain containing protein [Bacillus phage Spock]|uniref:Uncharacterized protein n=2 Tax=Bequatrovirus spock TaxID=1918008 RepID=A0A1X9SFT3_9CAUD|nr:ATP binding domain containing protein [Bacillus phage Spock]AGY48419.1 ATP binding domain containing protein [Bacillus phage Spock]ARQ94934.1 hypothetical protein FLAPJACK_20 [Bacillus phage Flapjack]
MELCCECCNKDVRKQNIWMAFGYEVLCKSCYEDKAARMNVQKRIIADLKDDILHREKMIQSLFKNGEGDYTLLFNERYEVKNSWGIGND